MAWSLAPTGVVGSQQASRQAISSGEKGWTIFCGRRTLRSDPKGLSWRYPAKTSQLKKQRTSRK